MSRHSQMVGSPAAAAACAKIAASRLKSGAEITTSASARTARMRSKAGAYSRGDHVWNPHSARAPAGILSVTVVGPELATADAYATAAFAMGPERAPHWTARLQGYEAMTILADETVFKTGGFPDE